MFVVAAGMMVTPTTPATGAGDGLLIALAVVNVFLLVSPIVMGFVLGLQVRFYLSNTTFCVGTGIFWSSFFSVSFVTGL